MDGRTDGWMDGWMDGGMEGRGMNGWMGHGWGDERVARVSAITTI
jgi:hypothetical protein